MQGGGGVSHVNIYCAGRAGTGPCGGERPPGNPGAAAHRHILDTPNRTQRQAQQFVAKVGEYPASGYLLLIFSEHMHSISYPLHFFFLK